ncbi:MAG TPA: hypothetical protein VG322_07035 [Candidatus Acidoferrales bacterium]|nr:hypothetical protein [Candidatus Acidoferrales bacterium]
MKRQEKRQMKAEKRAQRKLAKNGEGIAEPEATLETLDSESPAPATEPIEES